MVTRLRHGLGWWTTLACAVGAALVVLGSPAPDRVGAALRGLGVLALVALVGAYPVVLLDDDGVLVRNPWRTWRIGWPALDEVGFGWALWLRTRAGGGRDSAVVRALAAPGPARMRSLYDVHRTEGGVLERDAALTAAPEAAPAVVAVLQARERGRRAGKVATAPVVAGWSPGGLLLTVSGVVLLAAGIGLG